MSLSLKQINLEPIEETLEDKFKAVFGREISDPEKEQVLFIDQLGYDEKRIVLALTKRDLNDVRDFHLSNLSSVTSLSGNFFSLPSLEQIQQSVDKNKLTEEKAKEWKDKVDQDYRSQLTMFALSKFIHSNPEALASVL